MNATMIGIGFSVTFLVFAVPTAVFLIRAYSRSKMSGFMWLLGAVVVWPLIARGSSVMMSVVAAESHAGFSSMLGINLVMTVIGGALLLTAVIVLDRELGQRIAAAQTTVQTAAPPPTELA